MFFDGVVDSLLYNPEFEREKSIYMMNPYF